VRHAILRALHQAGGPCGASRLAEALAGLGVDLRPRAVRYHLLHLDRAGLTRTVDRRHGRALTARGAEEVVRAGAPEKVGFIASQVDDLGYRMSFDLRTNRGTMVVTRRGSMHATWRGPSRRSSRSSGRASAWGRG